MQKAPSPLQKDSAKGTGPDILPLRSPRFHPNCRASLRDRLTGANEPCFGMVRGWSSPDVAREGALSRVALSLARAPCRVLVPRRPMRLRHSIAPLLSAVKSVPVNFSPRRAHSTAPKSSGRGCGASGARRTAPAASSSAGSTRASSLACSRSSVCPRRTRSPTRTQHSIPTP